MNIIKGGKSSLPTLHLQICSHEHEEFQSLCEDTRPSPPLLLTIWQQPIKHTKRIISFSAQYSMLWQPEEKWIFLSVKQSKAKYTCFVYQPWS